ncbi:hypothetical protein ACGFZP_31860 [Kitasatospora sp. NPDC048239]|uniref:hypothetical protein n=1 Tax=Kitasatospora sp. NPDC048239 TaxID=3364046 RepID=UPI003714F326
MFRFSVAGEEYQVKSGVAARMGKAAGYLVVASAVLASGGVRGVSTSLVDDEGVDQVFHWRAHGATLAVRVKFRMMSGVQAQQGGLMALVEAGTFQPQDSFALLFVAVDDERAASHTAWLVPSRDFAARVTTLTANGCSCLSASVRAASMTVGFPCRLTAAQLPQRLPDCLAGLNGRSLYRQMAVCLVATGSC